MSDADPLNLDFARKHPDAFAKIIGRGDIAEVARILGTLPADCAASVAARLPAARIVALLASGQQDSTAWLGEAPIDDTIVLLSRIPRENCLSLINSIGDAERKRRLLQYLKYPAHSLGALVTEIPVRILADTPAKEALADIRQLDLADPGLLAVVDRDGRYAGTLDLWALFSKESLPGPVRDYSLPTPALHPETSLTSAIEDADWHHHNSLPVIDQNRHLLGAVSRASVFAAAARHLDAESPGLDLVETLFSDLMRTLAGIVEWLFTTRRIS